MSRDFPRPVEESLDRIASELEIANVLKAIELRDRLPAYENEINAALRGEF